MVRDRPTRVLPSCHGTSEGLEDVRAEGMVIRTQNQLSLVKSERVALINVDSDVSQEQTELRFW